MSEKQRDAEREQLRRDERDLAAAVIHHWPAREIRVSSECLSDTNARAAVKAAEMIAGTGTRVTAQTVLQQLTDSGAMERTANGHGDFVDFLIANPNAEMSPALIAADGLRERVLAAAHRREMRHMHAKAIKGLDAGEDPARIDAEFREASGKVQLHHSPPAWIEAKRPSEFRDWEPPEGANIIGDNHITPGKTFVIAGKAGVGKSLGSTALGISGATGRDWLGFKTHRKFKTLIIQNENGSFRLHNQFSGLNCETLDDHVMVTPPPPYGLAFDTPEFRRELKRIADDFKPDVVIIDPWNAVTRDSKERDFSEAFRSIWEVFPQGDDSPALGIVAHLRKSKADGAKGTALLDELSGSLKLGSVARTVFVMERATTDPEDNRVVFTCAKNNDGEHGPRSAWHRNPTGIFEPVEDFDFEEYDAGNSKAGTIDQFTLADAFSDTLTLTRPALVGKLEAMTGKSHATVYRHLKKLDHYLTTNDDGSLSFAG